MDIIKIEKGILKLNSGIAEENYGKMSYSQIIKEEGLLIHAAKTENGYEFNSESWTFDDVQSDGNVFYCGKVPFFSKKAASLLELLESENAFEAGNVIIHFLTENAKERRDINLIGAGGIYIEFDKKGNAEILMLPHDLFNYSIAGLSEKDKAELNNWWINPTLKNVQAYRFMRSVIAYKIITGNIPYPATDIIERNSDILDEKFLPLEYCINGINLNFADKINDELILNAASVTIPGKKQKKSIAEKIKEDANFSIPKDECAKEKFFSDSYFKAITDFPFDAFKTAATENPKEQFSEEIFEQKKNDFLKRQEKRVNTKRFIRRNSFAIGVVSAIVLLVAILVGNAIKTSGENQTTKSLTSEQTVEAYFKTVNTLDSVFSTNITKGRSASRYSDTISEIYVMSKNRQTYQKDEGYMNPAAFLLYTTEAEKIGKNGLYGVTNLKINGKDSNFEIDAPLKNQKPKALEEENGIALQKKSETTVTAEYYELHTEEDKFLIQKHIDKITLTFLGGRWRITEFDQDTTPEIIGILDFFDEYFDMLSKTDGDQIKAVAALKEKYEWLPKTKVIENEIAAQKARKEEFLMSFGF